MNKKWFKTLDVDRSERWFWSLALLVLPGLPHPGFPRSGDLRRVYKTDQRTSRALHFHQSHPATGTNPTHTQTASLTKQTLCEGTVWSGVKLWRRFFSFCVSAASDHRDGSSDSRLLHLQRERVQLLRVRNGEQSLCCQISVCMQHFIGFTQTWRSQAIIRLTYVHVFTFVVVSLMWNMNVWRSRCVHESWLISCICLSLWGCRW